MFRVLLKACVVSTWIIVSGAGLAKGPQCEIDNAKLRAMPLVEVELVRSDRTSKVMSAKLANNNVTRAAGFQRVCESTIESMPILFVFRDPVTPQFHMFNVVAPIDIAFIDQTGSIDSMHAMQPYVLGSTDRPLYGPTKPVVAALEVHKGFFDEHDIDLQTRIVWRDETQRE